MKQYQLASLITVIALLGFSAGVFAHSIIRATSTETPQEELLPATCHIIMNNSAANIEFNPFPNAPLNRRLIIYGINGTDKIETAKICISLNETCNTLKMPGYLCEYKDETCTCTDLQSLYDSGEFAARRGT